MRRTVLIALASVAVFGLVCVAVVMLTDTASPSITVQHIQTMDFKGESFGLTNLTKRSYSFAPLMVEVRTGLVWTNCCLFAPFGVPMILKPHGYQTFTIPMANLPTGSPLRLSLHVSKQLAGLEGFVVRCKLRFFDGQKVSLKPFDKTTIVFWKPSQIFSDEFTLPSAPASTELSPSAQSAGSK